MKYKFLRVIFASLVMAFCISTQVSAQGEGRLLFVKGDANGNWATGGIDMFGHYLYYGSGASSWALKDKTNLVSTPSYILAYSATTGAVSTLQGVSQGNLGPVITGFTLPPNLSIFKNIGNYIFLYGNGATGTIYRTYPDGTLIRSFLSTGFSHWSNIITTDNYIFFYNETNGVIVTAEITSYGSFNQSQSSNITPGYTLTASVGDNVLLYDRIDGDWESGSVLYTGSLNHDYYQQKKMDTTGSLGKGYNSAVQINGHLMLYDSATGNAAIGHFNQTGQFILDQKTILAKYWTHLVRCGQYLVLYGYGTGAMQVGFINNAGQYVVTQNVTAGIGWWNVASTTN